VAARGAVLLDCGEQIVALDQGEVPCTMGNRGQTGG
jgi:hypothetical protein